MALITVLRQKVHLGSIARHERLVRFVAERARTDADTQKWSARISTGSEGRSVNFVTGVEGFAALAGAEEVDAMIRRLFGEADGSALLEGLGEAVESESNLVLQPREDLAGAVLQLDAPAPLAVVTRLRPTPSGAAGCEDLIRKVIEAAAKVDEARRYNVAAPVIGELGTFTVVQGVTDPAQLDQQAELPDLLVEAFGAKEGESIFREGVACIQEAQSELSVLREDLSNLA
jgi:hypothetical protein